jgi:hypothetical protein
VKEEVLAVKRRRCRYIVAVLVVEIVVVITHLSLLPCFTREGSSTHNLLPATTQPPDEGERLDWN